ncbi:hypothetical protein ID866_7455 [Astraeus odoratus]|nr:hypothetical protein ID866_7455 [Astraeus odoratus]
MWYLLEKAYIRQRELYNSPMRTRYWPSHKHPRGMWPYGQQIPLQHQRMPSSTIS